MNTATQRTHYDVLCVPVHADAAQLKKAYRARARVAHPDHGGTDAEFTLVDLAYRTLIDERAREQYDQQLVAAGTPAHPQWSTTEPPRSGAARPAAVYVHRGAHDGAGRRASRAQRLAANVARIDAELGHASPAYRYSRYRELLDEAVAGAQALRRGLPGWSAAAVMAATLAAVIAPRWDVVVGSPGGTAALGKLVFALAGGALAVWAWLNARRRRGPLPAFELAVLAAAGTGTAVASAVAGPATWLPAAATFALAYFAWSGVHMLLRVPLTALAASSYRAWLAENADVAADMRSLRSSERRDRR